MYFFTIKIFKKNIFIGSENNTKVKNSLKRLSNRIKTCFKENCLFIIKMNLCVVIFSYKYMSNPIN